jgi:hypothetical protein
MAYRPSILNLDAIGDIRMKNSGTFGVHSSGSGSDSGSAATFRIKNDSVQIQDMTAVQGSKNDMIHKSSTALSTAALEKRHRLDANLSLAIDYDIDLEGDYQRSDYRISTCLDYVCLDLDVLDFFVHLITHWESAL